MANPALGYQLAQQGINLAEQSYTTTAPSTASEGVGNIFRYPLKMLDNNTDYIKIDAYKYEPPGLNLPTEGAFTFAQKSSDDTYRSLGEKRIKGTVILPIPQNLPLNNQSTYWDESKMGPAATVGLGLAMGTITSESFIGGLKSNLTKIALGIKDAATTSLGQKALQTSLAAKAVEQFLGQDDLFNTALTRRTGAVFNENVELLFRGINLRSAIDLTFDLAPRSKNESEVIRKMVLFLKKEMSASKGATAGGAQGLFLTAPSVFKVQYMSGQKSHPYLNKFKICALKNLNLGFTGSNTYATYSDGTPVHMNLTLTFQELTPIYAQDYETQEGTTGVGY